jgi:hypothetical protein
VRLTGLTGVEPLSESCPVSLAGTCLIGGAHRSDRCWSVDSRFGVSLRSRVERVCVLVPRSSGTPVATWDWPTWVVSRRRVLEAVFILLEFPSPSRRIFIGSHSPPPLSGSPYRSFRGVGSRVWRDRATRQPGLNSSQGANPGHTRIGPGWRRSQRHQRPADGQCRDTGGGRLPPTSGRALQQPGGPLTDAGAPSGLACSAGRSTRRASRSASASPH